MDNMFGLLLLDVTATIQETSRQSLVKTTLAMLEVRETTKFVWLPSNVGEVPPGFTKSRLLQLLILK